MLASLGGDAVTRFYGSSPTGALPWAPSNTLTATKNGSNPTLNLAGSAPENIVKVSTTYYLCYTRRIGVVWDVRLAHASSPNPSSWTDDGSILTCGSQSWETGVGTDGAIGAWIVEDSGTFYLFYGSDGGSNRGIGVATASSITGPYTKYASNPILSVGSSGAWDARRCHEPSVIKVGSTWIMAYMGESTSGVQGSSEKVGIATASSPTGTWTKAAGNPLISFGSAGTFDANGAADPSIYYDGSTYYWIWYSGLKASSGGKPWQCGLAYATSPTGSWTRYPGNPVLSVGSSGAFDNLAAWRGALYVESGLIYVPYGGIPSSNNSADAKGGNATIAIT